LQATCAAAQAGRVHGHAAGVITPVFKPLQALHQHGNDVARRNGADDATHEDAPEQGDGAYLRFISKKYPII
jgi:hypothetical protein